MSTIEALGLSPETAEAARRKAESSNMTLKEYVRTLVERDARTANTRLSETSDADIIGHNDAVLEDIARNRAQMPSDVGRDAILAALREGRGEEAEE